jgi:L-aspartate oxidase
VYFVHLLTGEYDMGENETYHDQVDVVIVGGGIAGLSVALRLPEHLRVALVTKGQLGESNTRYAQGGIAVAMGEDDSPGLHFQDTIVAGAGLCDENAVRVLVEEGPAGVRWLMGMGVQFDRKESGSDARATPDGLLLGREAAHSRWRVLHAGGDATGAEIERALVRAVRARSSIMLYEETFVQRLLVTDGVCRGVELLMHDGQVLRIDAKATVLASGGAGNLWLRTSNPMGATADGLALAWQAGAALTDLEFMQFHPTVLVVGGNAAHLISEAVRGEGAYLRNHAGERFMLGYSPQAELAPRDVVARSILSEMLREGVEYEYLDLRHLPAGKMYARFPTISAICRHYGLDLASDLLPVAPAAHYCMGGIMVDTWGRTSCEGLYAVGEVACTGVHGANRLASNSLLEGLVYGIRVADGLAGARNEPREVVQMRQLCKIPYQLPDTLKLSTCSADEHTTLQVRQDLRRIMWRAVSLCRDQHGLQDALRTVRALGHRLQKVGSGAYRAARTYEQVVRGRETVNMLHVAELVIVAALQRHESRGSHWRSDYPQTDEQLEHVHYVLQHAGVGTALLASSPAEVMLHV